MIVKEESENKIQSEILNHLDKEGYVWFWRNQVYRGRVKSGAWLNQGKKGIADIILIAFCKTIYIEVKKPGEDLTDKQKEFKEHCLINSQEHVVVESLSDLKEYLNSMNNEAYKAMRTKPHCGNCKEYR